MRLLFVLNIGMDNEGPSVHILRDIIEEALKRNHYCHIICKSDNNNIPKTLDNLVKCYANIIKISSVIVSSKKNKNFIIRYLYDCLYAMKCKKIYKKNKYNRVFLQSCNTGLFFIKGLQSLNCPIIFNIQDIFPQNLMYSGQLFLSTLTYKIFSFIQKKAYLKATFLITISEDMKDTLCKLGINRNKIEVIYNWSYSDSIIKYSELKNENIYDLKSDKNKINVVYAGNIGLMQNVEFISETARIYSSDESVFYYIIGDGIKKNKIAETIKDLKNIKLLPMQASNFAESIYAQADVNIIPLVKGGIKTALPSKTATVLRAAKNIIFSIDNQSIFSQLMVDENIRFTNNYSHLDLYQEICRAKNHLTITNINQFKNKIDLFSVNNAKKYIDVIENVINS